MRTIKKQETIRTDWHCILKEINRIGVFGAKKVQNITIKQYWSELHNKPEYTLIIDTMEEYDE